MVGLCAQLAYATSPTPVAVMIRLHCSHISTGVFPLCFLETVKPSVGKMCIADAPPESHTCSAECPVCYLFTLDNITKLLQGEKIELGDVDVFVQFAQAGCLLCAQLVACWDMNPQVHI